MFIYVIFNEYDWHTDYQNSTIHRILCLSDTELMEVLHWFPWLSWKLNVIWNAFKHHHWVTIERRSRQARFWVADAIRPPLTPNQILNGYYDENEGDEFDFDNHVRGTVTAVLEAYPVAAAPHTKNIEAQLCERRQDRGRAWFWGQSRGQD